MDRIKKYVRNDIWLILLLCVIGIVICLFVYIRPSDDMLQMNIYVDGELIKSVKIDKNYSDEIVLDTGNTVCIDHGYVYMKQADCQDGLCVKQGKIHKNNQAIICLPHKLVIRLLSSNDGMDVISR